MTAAQKSLWFVEQFREESSGSSNTSVYAMRLRGTLNTDLLEEALELIFSRHEALRTTFTRDKEHYRQVVHGQVEGVHLNIIQKAQEDIPALIHDRMCQVPNLEEGPLFQCDLVRLKEEEFVFIITVHHLVFDGWSIGVFTKELSHGYNQLLKGETATLPPLPIQYGDYTVWKEKDHEASLNKEIDFWQHFLEGADPRIDLPTETLARQQRRVSGKSQRISFEPEMIGQLEQACQQWQCSSFTLLFSAYALLLSKYSGQDDLLIAVPFANRSKKELEPMIGLFVNMLPIRIKLKSDMTFADVLNQVKEVMLDLQEHQSMDFATLQEHLNFRTDPAKSLFNVEFSYINADFGQLDLEGLSSSVYPIERKYARKDLTFFVYDYGQGLSGEVLYDADVLDDTFISRFINNFKSLVASAIAQNSSLINELNYITPAEKKLLLQDYNDTASPYPQESLVDLFRASVKATPDKVAIRQENDEVTYLQLEKLALATAQRILEQEMSEIVPIVTADPLSMITGVLGALMAGKAYMPMEANLAEERMHHMIREVGTSKILTEKGLELPLLSAYEIVEIVNYSDEEEATVEISLPTRTRDQTCYVMYTSGTTGKAKGVMITDKSVVRLVKNTNYISIGADDRILQTAVMTFDASTLEVWGALLNGATLVLSRKTDILNASVLARELKDQQITVLWLTSPLFGEMAAIDPTMFCALRYLVVGGDVIPVAKMNAVRKACPGIKIINGYGPTENTTFSATYDIDRAFEGSIPIGKPISNSTAYVLGRQQELLPHGSAGTLYVGGDGLSTGYFNDPGLTAEKFVPHPFEAGQLLYNTGDLVRWQADGNLKFMGRKDRQLKISGFRVEPAEVEQLLVSRPEITHAVIKADASKLIAYVVGENPDTAALKDYLQQRVLAVMVPEHIIAVSEIPKTPNGKIDFKALPEPQEGVIEAAQEQHSYSEVEQRLIDIWAEALEMEVSLIHPEISFFEIGGHSLMATQLVSDIEKEFDLEIDIGDFFEEDTIAFLAGLINDKGNSKKMNIPVLEPRSHYNISHSQRRIWVIDQIEGGAGVYDLSTTLKIKGSLKQKAFTYALQQMIKRYEILRTRFVYQDDDVFQKIEERLNIDEVFAYSKWNDLKADYANPKAYLDSIQHQAFDLSKLPLFRLVMLEINEQEFLLSSRFHHIISDEWSTKLFIKELSEYYNARINNLRFVKEKLTIQYKDFSAWNHQNLKLDEAGSRQYWLDKLGGDLPLNELKYKTGVRPATKTYEATSITKAVEPRVYEALNYLASSEQSTLFMVMLAALQLVIRKYAGEDDVVLGTAISGRDHHQLENQLGIYANTVVLRNQLKVEDSFDDHLQTVKKTVSEAFSHAEYPFDKLVDDLQLKNDTSRSPLFEIAFLLQDLDLESIDTSNFGGLTIENVISEVSQSAYDLIFNTRKKAEGLHMEVIYNVNLFDPWYIEQILDHYLSILDQVTANQYQSLNKYQFDTGAQFSGLHNPREAMEGSIISRFEEQVMANPKSPALESDYLTYNYEELNQVSNHIGHHLIQEYGVRSGDTIALVTSRKDLAIPAILGILKTGANYLPINVNEAPQRLRFMVEESSTNLILTDGSLDDSITYLPQVMIEELLEGKKESGSLNRCQASDIAYIIYTSGSTGLPKGVMIPHSNVVNLAKETGYLNLKPGNKMLQFSPLHFDPSVMEIFCTLLNGASLVIIEREKALESHALAAHLEDYQVDHAILTTAYFNALVEIAPRVIGQLDKLYFGGEAASSTHVRKALDFQKSPGAIVNLYGPTETTVCSLFHVIEKLAENAESIPIGKPVPGTSIYVLDETLKPVPRGITGELYIGGHSVSKGYLENPDLTTEKFIDSPFTNGEKLYRTGDMVYLSEQGEVEFLGRLDDLVKIRGHRIEIGEIEAAILRMQGITGVKVLPQQKNGRTEDLIAYLTIKSLERNDHFKTILAKNLPAYMIPGYFVIVEEFPINQNGKIDIAQLKELNDLVQYDDLQPPETEIEKQLSTIWYKHLQSDKIGIDQNFFEIGGHSLTAMKVASEIYHETGVNVPLKEFYIHPSIRELSNYVQSIQWLKKANTQQEAIKKEDLVI